MPPALVPAAIVGGTALSYGVAVLVGIPALVPFINVLPAFPFMVASLRRGHAGEAVWRMLVWAAAMAVCATLLAYFDTTSAGRLFLRGEDYRREMFAFIRTGAGREGDIAAFLPQHVAHAAAFCALAIATGATLAMPLGALLMNYMSYYVGALAAASAHPWLALAIAWVPWALVRVVCFVTLGVILAGPVLSRALGFPFRLRDHARWLRLAAAGLLLDVALKWALAGWWRGLLLHAAGWQIQG
jgi:hypothetical protein